MAAALTLSAQSSPPPPHSQDNPFPTWPDLIAKNYVPYHRLTPADFRIADKERSDAAYFVKPFMQPFYHFVWNRTKFGYFYAHITDWTIYSGLDRNESWRKSKLGDFTPYLPYAQAFLDLNELYARRLAALTPLDLPSGEGDTMQKASAQLDDRVIASCRTYVNEGVKETRKLNESTDNGRNQKKVREMAAEIKKRLAATARPASMPDPSATPGVSPLPSGSPRGVPKDVDCAVASLAEVKVLARGS